ncbi:response regulator transcription factor [Nocardioides aestuarii]|uniref:Response regulator transcription factor n=1 Tax=Nocardioides aestuarii TaxID=252231 RepID=A0ABW4TFB6_9ACTN
MPLVRIAVIDDHEIDVAGVSSVLGRFSDRVVVVAADDPDLDVVLYGARELEAGHDTVLHSLLRTSPATVIVLGWDPDGPQVSWAIACGAHGRLSKRLAGADLVRGLEQINHDRDDRERSLPHDGECHPALRTVGLTPRELEVLSLITQGLTNQEIADQSYISINSVKTYVRTAYRKIGVTRRSQAVSWGLRAGFASAAPTRERELV